MLGCTSVEMEVSKYVPTKYLLRLKGLLRMQMNRAPNGSNANTALSHTEAFLLFPILFWFDF